MGNTFLNLSMTFSSLATYKVIYFNAAGHSVIVFGSVLWIGGGVEIVVGGGGRGAGGRSGW